MVDWKRLPDEELARRGRHLVRHGHYQLGHEVLSEYCSRMIAQDRPVSGSAMAFYGLAIGMTGDVREGLETCQRALSIDRRSAEIWTAIARLSLHAGMRKKAVEAVARGLALAPGSRDLKELREALGQRRRPLVPFLPRHHEINVRLGRLLHRFSRSTRRGAKFA